MRRGNIGTIAPIPRGSITMDRTIHRDRMHIFTAIMSKNESALVSAVEKWLASVPKNGGNKRTITLVEILLRDLEAGGQGMWGPAILKEFTTAGLQDLPNKELSHQIRKTSTRYISNKGGSFTIASKPYRLVWRSAKKGGPLAKRRGKGEPPAEARDVSWFWEPFVEKHDRQDRVALIPEPTFHRTKDMTYIRNIDVNTDVPNPPELVRRIAHNGNKPTHLTPVKHYVSTGDVMAFAHVMRLFHKQGKFCALETMDHFTSPHSLPKAPLVVLGSGRTNWLVGHNEERFGLAFRMLKRGVRVDKKGTVFFEDPKAVYDDSTLREGLKPLLSKTA